MLSGTAGGLCSVYVVGISQFKPVFNLQWGESGGGRLSSSTSCILPTPSSPRLHPLVLPHQDTKIRALANPNTLNTSLNFEVIMPTTVMYTYQSAAASKL